MKLFIYYTRTGNGDIVADKYKELGFDLRKVESKYKLSKNLFLACMKGGFHAGINKKPKLINYNNDISNYDEIFIGSPIWNGRLACPINTVLKNTNFDNKKLTFVLYSGSGEAKHAVKRINKKYPNSKIILLKEPKKYNDELKKLED
jgi:flavodoxin